MNTNRLETIPEPEKDFSSTNVLTRMVDSIIFRYKWATEGLADSDIAFRLIEGSMNMEELLIHIHGMSLFTLRFIVKN